MLKIQNSMLCDNSSLDLPLIRSETGSSGERIIILSRYIYSGASFLRGHQKPAIGRFAPTGPQDPESPLRGVKFAKFDPSLHENLDL